MIYLPKNLKPEEVSAKEASRYGINAPWYDQKAKAVLATDGRTALVIPVDSAADDETGQLPVEALKAFRKATPRGVDDLLIVAENGTVSCQGITMARDTGPDAVRYPEVTNVIPKKEDPLVRKGADKKTGPPTVVGVNIKLLAKLAKAMGTETVRLQIQDPEYPIRVDPLMEGSGYGAIMPISGA